MRVLNEQLKQTKDTSFIGKATPEKKFTVSNVAFLKSLGFIEVADILNIIVEPIFDDRLLDHRQD